MPAYKLTYFDIRARGEPIRVILKLAGVEYEETRIPFASEEWTRLKKGTSIFLCVTQKRIINMINQLIIVYIYI